ncbi:MAG TPA: hypothetical protein VGD45_01960 [Steroidobacter sp.]|uniref:hypothetical protein n=1 Tax=Steroidobacter sp. TaxID=1978227 RepID=UPI002EDB3474
MTAAMISPEPGVHDGRFAGHRFAQIRCASFVLLMMPLAACGAEYRRLDIAPSSPDSTKNFVGGQGRVKVHFENYNGRADVEVFPEPPLTIQAGDGRCDVDGGVWVRSSVHLSSSGRVLMVQEYSGSADELVFYSTQTCKQELRIDVSGAKWAMSGERLLIGRSCTSDAVASCPKVVTYELDENELPSPAKTSNGNP